MIVVLAISLLVGFSLSMGAQNDKGAHAFSGKVEAVDAKNRTLTVNGEKVEGWMAAMTMNYKVDKPDVLKKVKTGDQISATVYDGDFETLHDVKVVPRNGGKSQQK